MAVSLKLSWQDRVSFSAGDGEAIVAGPGARLAIRPVAPEILSAMQRLVPPGEAEETLADRVLADGNVSSLARWYHHVDQFHRRGLVRRSLHDEHGLIATLVPLCQHPPRGKAVPSRRAAPPDRPRRNRAGVQAAAHDKVTWSLSRFAYLRNQNGEMVLESPLSHDRVVFHDPLAIAVVGALATPARGSDLAAKFPGRTADLVEGLVSLLCEAGMVEQIPAGRVNGCDSPDLGLEAWEFHDLLFHSRSRRGRSDGQFGATYRLAGRPHPPALKPLPAEGGQELYRPDLAQLARDDPPLARVQNQRRSLRQYDERPMTVRQLGELLFRVARTTEKWNVKIPGSEGRSTMELAGRPYPSGGALYEIEFYPVIRACDGLACGMYAYDPARHRLLNVAGETADVDALLNEAAASAGIDPRSLQVLLILSARFQRIAWKYESIAYALILKHVGVIYQTMYLAATAMGLAPCALGCGDSDSFARAASIEYTMESSVGEFLLGSRA